MPTSMAVLSLGSVPNDAAIPSVVLPQFLRRLTRLCGVTPIVVVVNFVGDVPRAHATMGEVSACKAACGSVT